MEVKIELRAFLAYLSSVKSEKCVKRQEMSLVKVEIEDNCAEEG